MSDVFDPTELAWEIVRAAGTVSDSTFPDFDRNVARQLLENAGIEAIVMAHALVKAPVPRLPFVPPRRFRK